MILAIFLSEKIKLERAEDVLELHHGGRRFADINERWSQELGLGFYDWLRASAGGEEVVVGVQLILHSGRNVLRSLLPERDYIEWRTDDIVRIHFSSQSIDEHLSIDQDFTVSRCLRAEDGSVALLFDASEFSARQISMLLS